MLLNEELLHAATCGDNERVKVLIQARAALEASDGNGFTSLISAATHGHIDTVRTLISYRASLEARDNNGRTPLMLSGMCGRSAVLKLLLDCKASCGARDNEGWTALMFAARKGNVDAVQHILNAGAQLEDRNNLSRTALMVAAMNNNAEAASCLLARGASLETLDEDGRSPLLGAIICGHTHVAETLIKANANVNIKDQLNVNWTPLMYACTEDNTSSLVRALLRAKASLEDRNHKQRTPLTVAIMNRHYDIARLLIEAQADLLAEDIYGRTPLHWAAIRGKNNVVAAQLAQDMHTTVLIRTQGLNNLTNPYSVLPRTLTVTPSEDIKAEPRFFRP